MWVVVLLVLDPKLLVLFPVFVWVAVRNRVQLESHTNIPMSVKECEGMNLHTPKWTPILGIGILMDSQLFKEWFESPKLIGLKHYLYH
jgi:hypothetical protein